jgi:hypothetical protein
MDNTDKEIRQKLRENLKSFFGEEDIKIPIQKDSDRKPVCCCPECGTELYSDIFLENIRSKRTK